jgi:hypothetical protein
MKIANRLLSSCAAIVLMFPILCNAADEHMIAKDRRTRTTKQIKVATTKSPSSEALLLKSKSSPTSPNIKAPKLRTKRNKSKSPRAEIKNPKAKRNKGSKKQKKGSSLTGCDLIITEFGSTQSNPPARFVELYSENCKGYRIGDDLKLVNFFPETIDLQLKLIGNDGFFVLCSNADGELEGKCDEDVTGEGPVDDDYVAIVDQDGNVTDVFGVEPEETTTTDNSSRELEETASSVTRFARDKSYSQASSIWQPEAWIEVSGTRLLSYAMDELFVVRGWAEAPLILVISELCNPSDDINNRFVELYSPNKRDYTIDEDLMLFRYDLGNNDTADAFIDLRGKQINERGFIVFCKDTSQRFDTSGEWDGYCDYSLGSDFNNTSSVVDWDLFQNIIMVPVNEAIDFSEYLESSSTGRRLGRNRCSSDIKPGQTCTNCATCSKYLPRRNGDRRLANQNKCSSDNKPGQSCSGIAKNLPRQGRKKRRRQLQEANPGGFGRNDWSYFIDLSEDTLDYWGVIVNATSDDADPDEGDIIEWLEPEFVPPSEIDLCFGDDTCSWCIENRQNCVGCDENDEEWCQVPNLFVEGDDRSNDVFCQNTCARVYDLLSWCIDNPVLCNWCTIVNKAANPSEESFGEGRKLQDEEESEDYGNNVCQWCANNSTSCESFKSTYPNCIVRKPDWIGDGFCDRDDEKLGGAYYTDACGWDGGDCEGGEPIEEGEPIEIIPIPIETNEPILKFPSAEIEKPIG